MERLDNARARLEMAQVILDHVELPTLSDECIAYIRNEIGLASVDLQRVLDLAVRAKERLALIENTDVWCFLCELVDLERDKAQTLKEQADSLKTNYERAYT